MKIALLKRLERLETVQDLQESDRRLKIEFAYLKQLPREYTGSRHIVTVGRRADGREECEERLGEPPPNHEPARNQNVMVDGTGIGGIGRGDEHPGQPAKWKPELTQAEADHPAGKHVRVNLPCVNRVERNRGS